MRRVRWALVGSSDFATEWLAPAIARAPGAELVATVSRDATRASRIAEQLGVARAYTSINELDRSHVDGVILAVANAAHAPLAIEAARRGFHVVVEKPMALTVAECDTMAAVAHERDVLLAVAHCMEWAPPLVAARALLAEGAIGTVRRARIRASFAAAPGTPRREGADTALYDMGVHAIDAILRLLGPVAHVLALDPPVDGDAHLRVVTTSGIEVELSSRWSVDENDLELVGDRGALRSTEWWGRSFAGNLTLERDGATHAVPLQSVNVYEPQFAHLTACAAAIPPLLPILSAARGRANIAVIEAARASSRLGGEVSLR